MAMKLGDLAPDFTAETTEGPISFHEWLGDSWAMFFSHPTAYTPVCTTELGMVAKLKPEFDKRNTKIIGLSVDPLDAYPGWLQDIEDTQNQKVNFPIIADPEKKVASLYGMIHPNDSQVFTVRSLFLIGPDKKIKLIQAYPASLGRDFNEILRALDSLQLTAGYQVGTPAGWQNGEDVIILSSVPEDERGSRFPKGYRQLKPYLVMTPQPDK
ncbi:MAG TPA: peroxiredoxin [Adhaeribacter sp.]|nr:peroxiredoxin [Adhaeribacter sp.]